MKVLWTLFLSLVSLHLLADQIQCQTPRGTREIVLRGNSLTFKTPFFQNRKVASIHGTRTKYQLNGFTKIWFSEGKKFTLHIENPKRFSNIDDYLVIRGIKGHEITFPLDCQYTSSF